MIDVRDNLAYAAQDFKAEESLGEGHVFIMQNWDGEKKEWGRKEWLGLPLGSFLAEAMYYQATPNVYYSTKTEWCVEVKAKTDIKKGDQLFVDTDGWAFIDPLLP